jgi:hypothetical protein
MAPLSPKQLLDEIDEKMNNLREEPDVELQAVYWDQLLK